jgi:hypothetical protein
MLEIERYSETRSQERPIEQRSGGSPISVDERMIVADLKVDQDRSHHRMNEVLAVI